MKIYLSESAIKVLETMAESKEMTIEDTATELLERFAELLKVEAAKETK